MNPMQALDKVISAVGQSELARRVARIKDNPKIRAAHVWNWRNRDEQVPADMVLAVEQVAIEAGCEVTRHEIRPDLYPKERVES